MGKAMKAKRVAAAAPAMKAMKAKRVAAAPAMKAMKAKRVAAPAPAMKAMKAKRVAAAAMGMKAMKAKRVAAPAMKAMKAKRVAAAAPAMKAMKAKRVAVAVRDEGYEDEKSGRSASNEGYEGVSRRQVCQWGLHRTCLASCFVFGHRPTVLIGSRGARPSVLGRCSSEVS